MNERSIFLEALEKDDLTQRSAYLDTACAGNAALRQRVEALLESHATAGNFLGKLAPQRLAEELELPQTIGEMQGETPETDVVAGDELCFLASADKPGVLGRLAHYEILEVIGKGGMGIVLRAFDEKLHRIVAIKVMAAPLATNATARQRFTREAQAQAAVSHDHIVTIHAVEGDCPQPYLVMQYVPGLSLQQRLDRDGPLALNEILRIGMQTASGLAAAHAQGLVHRDIKPANILLENGVERVKITDFGLARVANEASLTQSSVIAGTPQYMSPEQAEGEAIDPRTDLFSLGSVLYAMCTGRAPFRASGTLAVLKRVCEDTPTPIRETNPEIPDWLVAIIARLHAKDPAHRFQSATEVAELLGRHLAQVQHPSAAPLPAESASLAPSGNGARSERRGGGRRHRWAVAAAVLLLLLGSLSLSEATGVTNLRGTVVRILTPDGTLVVETEDAGVKVTIEGDGDLVITGAGPHEVRLRPGSYKLQAAKDGKMVRLDQELVTITRGDRQVVRVAVEPKRLGEPSAAPAKSDEIRRFKGHTDVVYDVAYSPKGNIVAAACHDGTIRLWDADSAKPIRTLEGNSPVTGLAFSGDGKRIVSAAFSGTVQLWDVATGKQLQRLESAAELHSVAISADGSLALSGGLYLNRPVTTGTIQLWDLKKGERIPRFGDQPSTAVYNVALSADGRTALSGGSDAIVRVWDVASGKELQRLRLYSGWTRAAFSSDGRKALSYGHSGPTIQLWSWEQRELVLGRRLDGHHGGVFSATFSPNGRLVISNGADRTLRLWDVESGKELYRFVGHADHIRGLAFSPDGKYVVSGSTLDGSVRLWKVPEPGGDRKQDDTSARPPFVTPWSDSDDWVVEGQELVQPDYSQSYHLLLFGDPSWTDYNFEAEVKLIAGGRGDGGLGLTFRARERLKDRLYFRLSLPIKGIREQGERSLLSWNGKFVGRLSVVPGETTIGRWYRMRVEARGNRFKMFLDGKLLISVYNEDYPRGCVGLSTRNVSGRFRNVKVTDPDGKILFEGMQNVLPKAKN